jgi:flagellar biosynthesis regulator FlbT
MPIIRLDKTYQLFRHQLAHFGGVVNHAELCSQIRMVS